MHDESGRGLVLSFDAIDPRDVARVGGKAANLARLAELDGVRVPPGFCVTTDAFDRFVAGAALGDRLARLAALAPDARDAIATSSAEVRRILEAAVVPGDVVAAIRAALRRLGEDGAYAVRSSATGEDSQAASFAGQQDSYLNVVGAEAIASHVKRCWASLFTERAVTYRLRRGVDPRDTRMAVVVQRMIFADVSGVLFTADPVSGHRKVSSVEASYGLGEALVSGLVGADVYKVRGSAIVEQTIGTKERAVHAAPGGGTEERPTPPARRREAALTEAEVVRVARLGRRIEATFGRPQDIEWCLVEGDFHVVQSRPITTLFPIPERPDGGPHVYISVGHQQMMTDAMKALGISFWKLISAGPMHDAGGRLFVDVTRPLGTAAGRAGLLALCRRSDPRIADALEAVVARGDFVPKLADDAPGGAAPLAPTPLLDADPSRVTALVARAEAALAALTRALHGRSGPALLDLIAADIQETKRVLFDPESMQVVMTAIRATWWLNEQLEAWLGEKNAADALAQSAAHNPTSEMGLALLDVADAIRPFPEVVAFLEEVKDDRFLDDGYARGLGEARGGSEARAALTAWLDRYGMRCPGEIDITRPRFRERPTMLLPTLLGNIKAFEPGEAQRRFADGQAEAARREAELLARLRASPDGEARAAEAKRMIDRVRAFIGYREYPKYGMVCRTFVYKQALLGEAARLVAAGVLREAEDVFHLTLSELQDVVRTKRVDEALLRARKEAFASFASLTPPRVLTSEGECLSGAYRRDDLPAGALAGIAVSAGTIEGRARVILDMARADLEPGDILVTAFTDPSWTPLFVAIKGLVTEVGGLMTHGAVIAREYGLPAVVGVEAATRRIRDGQRIRVNGTDGYVELLA